MPRSDHPLVPRFLSSPVLLEKTGKLEACNDFCWGKRDIFAFVDGVFGGEMVSTVFDE